MLFLPMYSFFIPILSIAIHYSIYLSALHLAYSNEPNFLNNVLLVAKDYFHFKLSNVTINALICMESYYFHVYSVSCDVHFRYSDDAFMWIA